MNIKLMEIARDRRRLHNGRWSQCNHVSGVMGEYIGLMGELAFAKEFNSQVDITELIGGDGGKDFDLGYTIDVKTFIKPYNLIVEIGKVKADIYVLGKFYEELDRVNLLGWEWGIIIKRCPIKDFGYGIINHYRSITELKPMSSLKYLLLTIKERGKS